MKKISILSILFFLAIGVGHTQPEQFTLLTKRTADWCPHCGTWGWTFVKDGLKELENENVIFWAMHYSGGLSNPTSKEVASNFVGGGQPIFYLNQDDQNVSSNNVSSKIADVKQTVQFLNSLPPIIDVSVKADYVGNKIVATSTVKVIDGAESDYNVSMFLIRDKLVANQASVGQNAVHPFILDAAFYDNTWGPLINDGNTLNAGDEFVFEETLDNITPHTANISDMKVVAVVWYKVNNQYTFINGDLQSVQLQSSTKDEPSLNFTHAVIGDQLELTFEENLSQNAVINLYSTNGQSIPLSDILINNNKINARLTNIMPGAFIVNIIDQNKKGSRKIYFVK